MDKFLPFALPLDDQSIEDYSRLLNVHLAQLGYLLRLPDDAFKDHIIRYNRSIELLLVSVIHHGASRKSQALLERWTSRMEDWARDYLRDIFESIQLKALKTIVRMGPFSSVLASFPMILAVCQIFFKSHRTLLERFYLPLVKDNCKGEIEDLLMALIGEPLASAENFLLVTWICRWTSSEIALEVCVGLAKHCKDGDELGPLLLVLATAGLQEDAFDCFRRLVSSHSVLSKLTLRNKRKTPMMENLKIDDNDEFIAVLDDKTFVHQFKDDILARALAEDEDEDEESSGQSNPIGITGNTSLDEALLQAYIRTPAAFERSNKARQSQDRRMLLESLRQTHEQIEGWAVMFGRLKDKEAILRSFALDNYKKI